MLKYARNYEEAKIIIKGSVDSDYTKYIKRKHILRAGLISTIAAAVATTLGIVTKSPFFGAAVAFAFTTPVIKSIAPIVVMNQGKKEITSDRIFENADENKIIELANEYVSEYNAYKSK